MFYFVHKFKWKGRAGHFSLIFSSSKNVHKNNFFLGFEVLSTSAISESMLLDEKYKYIIVKRRERAQGVKH